jgi:hypothetical protein
LFCSIRLPGGSNKKKSTLLALGEPINVAKYNHIFYPEVYKELVEACNLLPKASHFVTTDSVDKASIIQALHSRWSCHRDI